jgi:hypothetical protein
MAAAVAQLGEGARMADAISQMGNGVLAAAQNMGRARRVTVERDNRGNMMGARSEVEDLE